MAPVLAENKRLQSSVDDLDASLTLARDRERELELQVLDLQKERQTLEAENRLLTKRLSHGVDQQKSMTLGLALLMPSLVSCLCM